MKSKFVKRNDGFTLIEVLTVVIIIGILAAIIIPKLGSSALNARRKADIVTAHQVKTALDRYQLENGNYPKFEDLTVNNDGEVVCSKFIPQYISKLNKATVQQNVDPQNKGFGVGILTANADQTEFSIPEAGTDSDKKTIMIYLDNKGLNAEVLVYNEKLDEILWTSAN